MDDDTCRSIQEKPAGLEEKVPNHRGNCTRAPLSSSGLKVEDNPPGLEGQQHFAGRGDEPEDFRLWHGENFWGKSGRSQHYSHRRHIVSETNHSLTGLSKSK